MSRALSMRRWLLFEAWWRNLAFVFLLALLPVLLQDVLGTTALMASQILVFAILGLAFNILLGYTGLLSFGHGMFFGMGAYAASLIQIHFLHEQIVLPVLGGAAASMLLGIVVGHFILRRRGVYFALLTLAFTQLFFYVCYRWTELTGGENGLSGIKRPERFLGVDLGNEYVFYYLVLAVALVCVLLIRRLLDAPFGRVLRAIRDNEVRASTVGYDTRRYKHTALIVSAFFAGLAGSLQAYLIYFAYPEVFHSAFSGTIVAMTVVGGMGSFYGPMVGGALYVVLQDLLSSYTKDWMIFFGMIFMGFILFSPNGIMGLAESLNVRRRGSRREGPKRSAGEARHVEYSVAGDFRIQPPLPRAELLRVEGITKKFGALRALQDVSLSVHMGELRSIIGPNGAGKTTLFNVLSGILSTDAGRILFRGKQITGLPPHRIARAGISRSFQISSVFKNLTVFENIRVSAQVRTRRRFSFFADAKSLEDVNSEADRILALLGLESERDRIAGDISHGDQRLLEIGITLATRPDLLLLDEPLAGLGAEERVRIARLIRSLAPAHTVILIDHDLDQVLAMSDRVTVFHQGKVIADGKPEEVRADPQVQEAYIGGFQRRVTCRAETDPRASKPVLQVSGINTYYGKSHILRDVSLTVHEGELVCLLGRNGAGKTTTLHSIVGLAAPSSGTITLAGEPISRLKPNEIANRGIQLVPQGRRIFPNLTVLENLEIGFRSVRAGSGAVSWTPARALEILPQLGRIRNRRGENLSGGELQMLAVARALMGNGRILLLDEPFEGLAPSIVDNLRDVILQLREEMTILLVEQSAEVSLSLGERAYVLNNGAIEFEGTVRQLAEDRGLRVKLLGV